MLDAIAQVDNLGMEDSTLAADASPTSLDTSSALSESQGSSIQETDFNQSLMGILSSLDAEANATNPSLEIVSGQSLEDALADAIPGLDPTTVTPPDPLAQDSILNPFMAALSELDNPEALGEAFQTLSDGFEGLSNSFEQLAASFLQDSSFDTVAIDADSDDASSDLEVKNIGIDDTSNDTDVDTDFDTDVDTHSGDHSDKVTIADNADTDADTDDADTDDKAEETEEVVIADVNSDDIDTTNADFGINNLAPGTDFDLDFDALKVNVDQVSQGLQFLVQQLEAAFESDDSTLTTKTLASVTQQE